MSERISEQVRTIEWDERRGEAEKRAMGLFAFEREEYLKLVPYGKNERGGTPELNRRFRRIDVSGALKMLKEQVGMPLPVPRFALLKLAMDREVRFSFNLMGEEVESHGICGSNGRTLEQVPPWDARGRMVDPMRKVLKRRYDGLMDSGGVMMAVGGLSLMGCVPGFIFGGMWCGLGAVAGFVLLFLLGTRRRMLAEREVEGRRERMWTFRTRPGGFVPDDVRRKVEEEAGNFEAVCLLFEAEWSVKEEAAPSSLDPLVVGYCEGAWYVIADFDLTDKERYVKQEFGA